MRLLSVDKFPCKTTRRTCVRTRVCGRAVLGLCLLTLAGCVTTTNQCGNEQRDWQALSFPKDQYCSIPPWVPFSDRFEAANKAVCKVHDNNSGKASTLTLAEADDRYLCDYLKRSEFPWGVRHVTGYLSYWSLRVSETSRLRKKPLPFVESLPERVSPASTTATLKKTTRTTPPESAGQPIR